MMTKKDLFKAAHKIARETREMVGDYRIAFMIALKDLYKGEKAMCEKTTEQKLEDLGIEAWERNGMKRYYINEDKLEAVFGLRISRYNTGNICGARLNGEPISHNKAGKLIRGKIYFDATIRQWKTKDWDGSVIDICDDLKSNLRV